MIKFLKKMLGIKPKQSMTVAEMAALALAIGQIEVRILADSISQKGDRIVTYQLKYWRAIHGEFMTHRVFGRNASSSRAIPVKVILAQVWSNPAYPMHWGMNQGGMQAKREAFGLRRFLARFMWKMAGRCACCFAWVLMKLGIHKQVANRILEPWQFIHVVVTATEYDNFFELRDHEDAQPEIHVLAHIMNEKRRQSRPTFLKEGEWHLPYITHADSENYDVEILKKVSAARCCRVSYMKHDGSKSTVEEDLKLCERLVGAAPLHASPFEHQASPDTFDVRTEMYARPQMHGNLKGWVQHRKFIESAMWKKD